ncbi:hypothetical protein BN1723_015794 [Verticillium longisporum]|uniref:Uncharacterized protein n=1 Tax=Verticillium longisporum TaxID=100787 RepID=A0A0G4N2V8_VERLO|nr:hypothetical protein BN1723_015794 [Verticillium longisporum]
MSLFAAQLHPGRALGFLILGASLHDVLTRLKAEPQRFPQLDLAYSRERPIEDPVSLTLPANGLRLRFDGPEQRLRLIEIIDFTKNHITFKDRDLVKPANAQGPPSSPMPGESSAGPTFRHIFHRLLGPTYGGEYIPPTADSPDDVGNYVLSYPGVAFTFRLAQSAYSPNKDVVSLLSSSAAQIATSMAVFAGDSWSQARENIWSEILPSIKTVPVLPRGKDVVPDEISLVKIHGGGKIQLFRKWTGASFWRAEDAAFASSPAFRALLRLLADPDLETARLTVLAAHRPLWCAFHDEGAACCFAGRGRGVADVDWRALAAECAGEDPELHIARVGSPSARRRIRHLTFRPARLGTAFTTLVLPALTDMILAGSLRHLTVLMPVRRHRGPVAPGRPAPPPTQTERAEDAAFASSPAFRALLRLLADPDLETARLTVLSEHRPLWCAYHDEGAACCYAGRGRGVADVDWRALAAECAGEDPELHIARVGR